MPRTKKSSSQHDDSHMHSQKGKKGGQAAHSGGSIVGPAIIGAVAGAAVGVAASMALSDDKTREKATQMMGDIRDKAVDTLQDITKGGGKTAKKAADMMESGAKTVKRITGTEDTSKQGSDTGKHE